MPIHKSKHAGNFTSIPNSIFKNGLSAEACGMLCYFLTLPHDWIIYKVTLHTQKEMVNFGGEKKIDRVFKELQKAGYIMSVKRHKNGKYEYEHIVYDIPWNGEKAQPPQNVGVGFVGVENQRVEKEGLLNTNTQNTNVLNKIKIGSASFFDLITAINSNIEIYKAVIAIKKETTTEESILAALNDRYPYAEFTDINHFKNAVRVCIKEIEGVKKKVERRESFNPSQNGMVY